MNGKQATNLLLLHKVFYRLILPLALTGAISTAIYAYANEPSDFAALAPGDISAIGSIDSSWLWINTSLIRSNPVVAKTMDQVQQQIGFNYATDISPWLGRVTAMKLTDDQGPDRFVVFAQIRDPAAFANALLHIGSGVGKSGMQTSISSLDGHQVTSIAPVNQPQSPIFSFTVYQNWLIVGYGDGSLKDVFDDWADGNTLSKDVAYSAVLKNIGAKQAVAWAVANAHQFNVGSSGIPAAYAEGLNGISLFDKGNTVEVRYAKYCTNSHAVATIKEFASRLTPVTGSSLKTVPNDALGTLIIANPSHWANILLGESRYYDPDEWADGSTFPSSLIPDFFHVLNPVTGEFALSLAINDKGSGVVASMQTGSESKASAVVAAILQITTKMNLPVTHSGDLWRLTSPQSTSPDVDIAMRTTNNIVQVGSNLKSVSFPEGQSGMTIPADAAGSAAVVLTRQKGLDPLLNNMTDNMKSLGPNSPVREMDSDGLFGASLVAWMRFDPSGRMVSGTLRISNFKWKTALNQFVSDEISGK